MANDSDIMKPRDSGRPGFLALCGISHKTATLSEREPFHISRNELIPAVKLIHSMPGVQEAIIVATCNRVEIYTYLDEGMDTFLLICDFFRRLRGVEASERRGDFYVRHGSTTARHLFRVISGLDSLVTGEYQIQSQIKEAYSAACSARSAGKVMHRLFHNAFRIGKAVRTKTGLGEGRYSVSGVAVQVIRESLRPDDTVLVVGINESTRIIAEGLAAAGHKKLLFANRTACKAEKMASRYESRGFGLDDIPAQLDRCQVLVTCTGAPGFVISSSTLNAAVSTETGGPRLIVDMAVPRDVEVDGSLPDQVRIVDMEDLKVFLEAQKNGRLKNIPDAESMIENLVGTFQAWIESAFDPGVANLAREYEKIRQKCLEEMKGHFSTEAQEGLEGFSRRLMQGFLKVPARTVLENGRAARSEKCCRQRRLEAEGVVIRQEDSCGAAAPASTDSEGL